jgi:putative transposase
VDPDQGLGPLCHYIHLNPVRAQLCAVEQLPAWPWSSVRWLLQPKVRPAWFDPEPALEHAGGLKDTPAGQRNYLEYLAWLAEDEPARKAQQFDKMSRGWIIGSVDFAKTVVAEHRAATGHGRHLAAEMREVHEAIWEDSLRILLRRSGRHRDDLAVTGKSEPWKLALAAALKARTTVTNRWLGANLNLGNLYEVSRKVAAWARQPDPALVKKLQ